MIAAHDTIDRLGEIDAPTLVMCGDNNHCTPRPLAEEITEGIPDAELVIFDDAGELIEIEQAERGHIERPRLQLLACEVEGKAARPIVGQQRVDQLTQE